MTKIFINKKNKTNNEFFNIIRLKGSNRGNNMKLMQIAIAVARIERDVGQQANEASIRKR